MRLFVGGRADFLRELVDFGDHVGDLAQRGVQLAAQFQSLVHDGGGAVHVLDRLAGFLLNALDQFRDFLGRLRRFLGQFAHFVGDDGESQSVFSGAGSFNGGVQGQQVGLLGEIVDDFDDLANVVGALSQGSNDFARRVDGGVDAVQSVGGLLHGADAVVDFLARTVGDVEQHFRRVGHALDRSHHLIDGSRSLADARSLHLRALHHVLHVDAHLVHRAGDFIDGGGCLQPDFGGIVGGSGHLVGGAGYLGRCVADTAYQPGQTFDHAREGVAQSVVRRPGLHLHRQIATGDGFGYACLLLNVADHFVEGAAQSAALVAVAVYGGSID